MTVRARLIATRVPKRPSAAVLVLHGGGSRQGDMRVSPTQLSVLRMIPIAKRIAGRGRLAVFRLLNSTRGWDTHHTPVDDVRWALEQLHERFDEAMPTALVGHSLGGRAALLAGSHPAVTSVVALNPFVYPQDGQADLSGRRVLIVHGMQDRVASLAKAEAVARALSRLAEVDVVRVAGGKHSMLARHRVFDGLAAEFVAVTHLGATPTGVLADVLRDHRWRDV